LRLAEGTRPSRIIDEILSLAKGLEIPVQQARRTELDRIHESHQGVALDVGRYPYAEAEDLLATASRRQEAPFLLALDHLQDPHNLGALLRSAEAVGVHGVIIPDRRSASVTPAVVNSSAGASEHIQVAQVTNLVRSLEWLKNQNIWAVGLDAGSDSLPFDQVDLDRSLVIVVGAEGKGLSQLVKKNCDILIRLPMRGKIESLNASVAGSIVLYAALSAR
jgi:23S rRNA (guanosine2251-2'-O)-methyltransferase